MKKIFIKNSVVVILAVCGLSSCYKKFDASSYAPPLNVNGYTAASQIENSALVAYWGFNGDLADSVSNTAGVATGTSFTAGMKNHGQALQGANNGYVVSDVPAAIKSLKSFTLSMWVNMPQNTTGAIGLIDIANSKTFWGNLTIFYDNGSTPTTGVLKVHMWNNGNSDTGSDAWEGGYTVNNPWGAWTNITVSYNDATSTVTVYYNGSSVGTNTAAGFAPLDWSQVDKMAFGTLQFQTTPSLTTATDAQGWASYLTGSMDEVRVYNKVLSGVEISSLVALQQRGK